MILITGGAGYIGSHIVSYLKEKGKEVIVVDNLSTGHKESTNPDFFYQVDLRDTESMDEIFSKHKIDGVIHFAALSLVGDSMTMPYEYYHNNVYGMLTLLQVMKKHKVHSIVFSSTAATYGEVKVSPITEDMPTKPTNPYGETKLTMEKMMHWFETAYGMRFVSLRYFNAAGAHPDGHIGEAHTKESHLIPLVLQVPLGKREKIMIFGDDYPTPDGSCVRDYVHVMDLASAHDLALEYLQDGGESQIFNLGNGNGYSVKEVIEVSRQITGHPIPAEITQRRPGDPATLVASSEKIQQVLDWKPKYPELSTIIKHAWSWHQSHPDGY